ncbi:T9SS type A sorting domain-containing protein [candidate division KSB1 bacterium]|nr:T9SS type A sorting domain-containing protein [candidate division KSB1 bacterium]
MKKMISHNWYMIMLCVVVSLIFTFEADASDDKNILLTIEDAIERADAQWTVGESWVSKLPAEERRMLCGTIIDRTAIDSSKFTPIETRHDLPAKFDWRDQNGGNWITPVKDQGMCGSCWDFAAIGQIEAWWRIHNSRLDSVIDLSEQFVLSCSMGSCDGYTVEGAFDFVQEMGVPPETCMYYNGLDSYPCSRACAHWEELALKIPGWGYITLDFDDIDNIKTAILQQPVAGSYIVYEDFMYYSEGVYEHVWGEIEAGHAVLIVGWDDEQECWICKNSWGPAWGEQGYFRIKWGECGMGEYVPFIWNNLVNKSEARLEPMRLNMELMAGDTAIEKIRIFNHGDDVLQYSAVASEVQLMFHPDEFQAFDDRSWWCGDPDIGGYGDHWLQYLETPIIDLSNTMLPRLRWMGKWNIENPSGATYPYDGWDGCNVWISTDGGTSFNVLHPLNPSYNCFSLWSFGHPEQGWNMGTGVAGWGGESNGWTAVEMDLVPFRADSVVIRYAFASDMGLSTLDDPGLTGFFVDDIRITDGMNVLFQNTSNDSWTMNGLALSPNDVAGWFYLSEPIGSVPPHSSKEIDLHIKTAGLATGSHSGLIMFISNDSSNKVLTLPVTLHLEKPEHDIVIDDISLFDDEIVLLSLINLIADIRNGGKHPESDFDVVLTARDEFMPLFSDTVHIDHLDADQTVKVPFAPFSLPREGDYSLEIKVEDVTNDYNPGNSRILAPKRVVNLVDDFEQGMERWVVDGGWSITDEFKGFQSDHCLHVNGGVSPYPDNMDASCRYLNGLSLDSPDDIELEFRVRYNTESDSDQCFIEVSRDCHEWIKVDSLSGISPAWTKRMLNLSAMAGSEWDKLWFRFHFISDHQNSAFGVLIDDVHIYRKTTTSLSEFQFESTDVAKGYELSQNYPNPFNMSTQIQYQLPRAGHVTIAVFNLQGQRVAQILNTYHEAGEYTIDWNGMNQFGKHIGSGVYFYRIDVDQKFIKTNKMVVIK